MKGPFRLSRHIKMEEGGKKLGDFIRYEMQLSRKAITAIKFKGGAFLIDGIPQTVSYVLKGGEQLDVLFPPENVSETLKPENLSLELVFEDEYALVINKPAGMPTIPSFQHYGGTLASGVLHYLIDKGEEGVSHPVTRLDRETSGLVLMAKHAHVHDQFSRLQKAHEIERRYLAIVHHPFEKDHGTIDAPIGRKDGSIIERCIIEAGKQAVTHYEVLWQDEEKAVVGVKLETGRTHQIRVHFSSIGHPLLGDDLYGGKLTRLTRQALHARHLYFTHPLTQNFIFCTAPLPQDLQPLLKEAKEAIYNWDQSVVEI